VKLWVRSNQWFYWCSYAVFLITYITLVCCDGVRRSWPANIICLAIFTMAFSYMAGTISSFYDTQSVLVAVGITAAVCLSVSLFAIQTRIDFTMCSGLIFAFCMVFIFFGFACLITYLATGPSYAHYVMHCVYGGLAAGLFSLFLVFDTQMVIGGHKRRYQLSPEEYIYGALQLYVDVVNLFIIMLGLFGNRN
jgi:FtsH-binding integral membrane protein